MTTHPTVHYRAAIGPRLGWLRLVFTPNGDTGQVHAPSEPVTLLAPTSQPGG